MSPNATEEKSSLRCQGWGAGVETLLGVTGEVQACLLHVVIWVSPVSGGLAPACRLEKVLMQNISVHGWAFSLLRVDAFPKSKFS